MKTILLRTGSLILAVILACFILPMRASAGFEIPGSCQVQTDTGAAGTVKTLDYRYDRNTYYSLRDMAMLLRDTDRAFFLEVTGSAVTLNPGGVYTPVGVENMSWEDEENPDVSLRRNEFKINQQTSFYYTLIVRLPSGDYDCFMMAADLAMILDVDITVPGAGSLVIHTQEPFCIFPDELERAGYFCGVNGVLAGDATTGEIYYRYQADTAYPIASTSKLMTCLLVMDAISAGWLAPDEPVTVSEAVQLLAASDDGVIPLKAGEQITVQELLVGALLPSSNECAMCLAEAAAGSEEAFVERMNQKALELGLSQAIFYNSHGLPCYTEDFIPSKLQNSMSAEDMFRLVSYLLKVYPQITEITSLESATLETLDLEVRNTNPLLYNLPEVTGLKTGTTNRAGACLVTSLRADGGAGEHDLVVVVFGTEDSTERGRVSGLLSRYALDAFYTGTAKTADMGGIAGGEGIAGEEGVAGEKGIEEPGPGADARISGNLPVHAEAAVDWIIRAVRN